MKRFVIALIRGYQRHISPGMPDSCRYYPSCSEYSAQAIDHYGVPIGLAKTIWRLLRCHPLSSGGYDQPHHSGSYQEIPRTDNTSASDADNNGSVSRP